MSANKTDDAQTIFSTEDQDTLCTVGSVAMDAVGATLSTLLNRDVKITSPKVSILTWDGLRDMYGDGGIGVRGNYIEGLSGANFLILRDKDAKIIANAMMGGAGQVDFPIVIDEMDLSAVREAMNQMIGTTATTLSKICSKRINIDVPETIILPPTDDMLLWQLGFASNKYIAMIDFRIEISGLINSEFVQIFHLDTAIELISSYKTNILEAV